MSERIFTVTVELKCGTEASFAVRAGTAPAARNIVGKAHPVQFAKSSRGYQPKTDAKLPRIGW